MSRPLPFSPRDGREDNRESNKTKSPPSPGTMAGPGQDKGRPDTSGHKRPSVKKNWEGCFMALRMDILVKPDPSHPQLLSVHWEKTCENSGTDPDFFLSLSPTFEGLSPDLEENHYSWNFLLMKESLPSYVFIFRNWQSIVFHEKKNSGSRYWWRDRGERVIRDVIIWSFWGCLKFKLRTTEHLSF